MNTQIITIFLVLLAIGLGLFWLFFRKSNSIHKQAEKYLRDSLKDTDISVEQTQKLEKQLSALLQRQQNSTGGKMVAIVAVFLIPFSLYFYTLLGNPAAIEYIPQMQQPVQQTDQSQMSMQDAIAQLEARLIQNPDDVDGQVLYARSQVSLKNYDQAVSAYRKANELVANEAVILTELAEAIALANNNRSFLGEPEQLLAQAVELSPNNQTALWLLGMTFYERKNFIKTNEIWTRLHELITNEGAKQQLAEQLKEVRAKLEVATNDDIQNNHAVNLQVMINFDNSILPKQQVKRAILYVYAKATTNKPMPIAVIQKNLEVLNNSFPITVTLNDNHNLQASRKLSDFSQIKIGARISLSGNATAQAGDLQSQEIEINLPYSKTVELVIDSVRP
ncbi:hypothetical protein MNBD_GAMMA01-360 [hydrothermal vent metagenome]|uniref:Uncharacterized protein n=1 Tax=hydrothermal vent metagenome TaxID=652676 RepID=A0A3B0UXT0_9ZZZZ